MGKHEGDHECRGFHECHRRRHVPAVRDTRLVEVLRCGDEGDRTDRAVDGRHADCFELSDRPPQRQIADDGHRNRHCHG